MDLLILAAGYATRLYPLTRNQPKPLLPVAGRPMIEHLLDSLLVIPEIHRVDVVTNDRFTGHFEAWAARYQPVRPDLPIRILNDGSTDDTNKRGAIGDLHFAVTRGGLTDDLIVVAGDNLFGSTLEGFGRFCREKQAPVIAVYDVGSLELARQYNSICLDAEGRLTFFEEKASDPAGTLCGIALYHYPGRFLGWIDRYLNEGGNPDQPGRLIQWMYSRMPVYAWQVPGIWYDIGSKESLEEANRIFADRVPPATKDPAGRG